MGRLILFFFLFFAVLGAVVGSSSWVTRPPLAAQEIVNEIKQLELIQAINEGRAFSADHAGLRSDSKSSN